MSPQDERNLRVWHAQNIPTLPNGVKIIPVFGTLYDLFYGEGWTDCTRVSAKRKHLWVVAGNRRDVSNLHSFFFPDQLQ